MKIQNGLNRDVIKYIASFTMLLNHISFVFLDQKSLPGILLTDIGFFTGITMVWFLIEGYEYTKSKKAYANRLLFFAVISQIPYCLAFTKGEILSFYGMNMIFTLWICFWIVHVMHTQPVGSKRTLILILLVCVTYYSDWGILAPLFAYWFAGARCNRMIRYQASFEQSKGTMPKDAYQEGTDQGSQDSKTVRACWNGSKANAIEAAYQKEERTAWIRSVTLFGIMNLLGGAETFSGLQLLLYVAGTMVAPTLAGVCILKLYNGKKMQHGGRFSKWFFYIFYPGHLLLLGLLRIIWTI